MNDLEKHINKDWALILKEEFKKKYFIKLKNTLANENKKFSIYPKKENIFHAFNLCPFKKCKVIILGQDPYHNKDQANGLCFSVNKGTPIPKSLKNIFKEISEDLKIITPKHGDLSNWATQGVLLINSFLTVRKKLPKSHQKIGWETFIDNIIKIISTKKKNMIFILWGNYAQNKIKLIDSDKHFILKAKHPSPLSAHRGFFGCKHFSMTNSLLKKVKKQPIIWRL
ncbi:MAG: uracil-DNA glycosylase [Flavobacteriales bacterium]|nr:uracil-DNA glycosylase [Flavobacteriales bacterium]